MTSKRKRTAEDEADVRFRRCITVPLLKFASYSFGVVPPFDRKTKKRLVRDLALVVNFFSEDFGRRGRPSRFPVKAFFDYSLGERGDTFFRKFIPGYARMTRREKDSARSSFYGAYRYFRKKQAKKLNNTRKLVVA